MAKCERTQPGGPGLAWVTNPDLGRLVFFVFLAVLPVLFATTTLESFEYPKAMWLRACMLCLLAPAVIAMLVRLSGPWRLAALPGRCVAWIKSDVLSAGVLLFFLSALVSTLKSLNPRISWWGEHPSYAGLVTIGAHVLVYFAARALGNSRAVMERLLAACLLAGLVAAAFAGLQLSGVDPVGWQSRSAVGAFQRPFGTLGHPNHLGAFLAMIFPVAMYFALPVRSWGMPAVCVVVLAGLLVSLSRAAWLGWAAGMAFWLVAMLRERASKPDARRMGNPAYNMFAWTFGVFVLALIGLTWWNPRDIVSGLQDRLSNLTSGQARFLVWKASLDMFHDHPLFGTGPDTFQLAFAPRRTSAFWDLEWNSAPTRAHNEFLHVLATQGMLGVLALVVFLVGLTQAARRALRHQDPGSRRLALALTCGGVVFFVVSLFSFTALGYGPVFLVFAAFLSRLGAGLNQAAEPESNPAWFRPALWSAAILIFLHFVGNLSFGLSAFPASFWSAISILGTVLATALLIMHREFPSLDSLPRVAGAPANAPTKRWLPLASLAVLAPAMLFLVILPWLAHIACARGAKTLADDPEQALHDLEQAVALDPSWDIYWTKLAQCHQQAAAKVSNPESRRAYLRRALDAWDRLIRHKPLNGFHHDNRGLCLALLCKDGLARPDEVFAAFEEAIRRDPTNPLFFADAADAALRLGRNDLARGFAAAGLKRNSRYAPLYGQVGYLNLVEGNVAGAIANFKEAAACHWDDDHPSWKSAAQANQIAAYHQNRDYEMVEKLAVAFLRNHPGMAAIQAMLADARLRLTSP